MMSHPDCTVQLAACSSWGELGYFFSKAASDCFDKRYCRMEMSPENKSAQCIFPASIRYLVWLIFIDECIFFFLAFFFPLVIFEQACII